MGYVIVPKDGPFIRVIKKIEDLISSIFLSLYFFSNGLKTTITMMSGLVSWSLLLLVITIVCIGKIVRTIVIFMILGISFREAIALWFLMNTKGPIEIIVLNIGKDFGVFNDEFFAILVFMTLFTTFITIPVVTTVYKPARRTTQYHPRC